MTFAATLPCAANTENFYSRNNKSGGKERKNLSQRLMYLMHEDHGCKNGAFRFMHALVSEVGTKYD